MLRSARIAATGVIFVSLALLSAPAAAWAADDVTVGFTTADVTVVPGNSTVVALTITNASTTTDMTELALTSIGDDVVSIVFGTVPASIPAGGSAAIETTITLTATVAQKVNAVANLSYTFGKVKRVSTATLGVTQGAWPTAAPGPVSITSQGTDTLIDAQVADIFFTIKNGGSATQQVDSITLTYPAYLVIDVVSPPEPDNAATPDPSGPQPEGITDLTNRLESLRPGADESVHVQVRAPNGVQPGTVLVILNVEYTEKSSGAASTASGSHSLTLSVFGEDAVTGAFGLTAAPALFVVPGLLFVIVLFTLWTKVAPRTSPIPLITDVAGLTGAIALAIAALFPAFVFIGVYRVLFSRDIRTVYGFADIPRMLFFALGCAIGIWLLGLSLRAAIRHFRLEPGDSAASVLRKLSYRSSPASLIVTTAQYTPTGGTTGTVAVLRTDGETSLVSPIIELPPAMMTPYLAAAVQRGDATDVRRSLIASRQTHLPRFVAGGANLKTVTVASTSELLSPLTADLVRWAGP